MKTLDLEARVNERPWAMIGAAVGVGYVLGGGLFTGTTVRLIGVGLKLAVLPPVRDALIDLAHGALVGGNAPIEDAELVSA